jgi:peptide/nickel transport system substrate-binding protein
VALGLNMPAHVVAMHALGESDPTQATQDMMKVFTENTTSGKPDKDLDKLKKVSDFWNSGFDTTQLPSDKSLYLSDGMYLLTDWKKDQYMTFEANPDYNWGPKPNIKTIVYQYAPDPTGAVQSVQNGDIQVINPQATPDVVSSLQTLQDQGVKTINEGAQLYEHVDLVFDNGGPFDPKTYGGGDEGAKKALAVRKAFLETVPRQQIFDRLIKPLYTQLPKYQLRDSFMLFPGQPGYDEMVAQNGMKAYDDAGSDAAITRAKKLLSDAGVKTPITVRLMYADQNPRRAQEYSLIAASAKKAGFTVKDGKNANWSSLLSNNKVYDASLFAWQSTSTGVAQNPPNYLCKTGDQKAWGQNNFTHYCNEQVNKDMLDLQSQPDPAKQMKDMQDAEKQLVADGFGTLLYQYPNIIAYDSTKVTGVSNAALSPGFLWDVWSWKAVSG